MNDSSQIFDRAALKRNFADDLLFVARLLAKFEGRCPAQLNAIREALAQADGPAAGDAAHRLAGETGVFYAIEARRAALRLEELARAGAIAEARDALAPLIDHVDRLVKALRELPAS